LVSAHDVDMAMPDFEPLEGGVKIVFDVPESAVEQVVRTVGEAGFDVRRYYAGHPELEHGLGGSAPGYVRMGAERQCQEFSDAEQAAIVAAFDAVQARTGFVCTRAGVDVWTAGD
jgi:hypothetical protein